MKPLVGRISAHPVLVFFVFMAVVLLARPSGLFGEAGLLE